MAMIRQGKKAKLLGKGTRSTSNMQSASTNVNVNEKKQEKQRLVDKYQINDEKFGQHGSPGYR